MPRYRVTEERSYTSTMIIDAVDAEAAERGEGEIIEENATDSFGAKLLGVEEIGPEEDS
jgi:hypothetical protein